MESRQFPVIKHFEKHTPFDYMKAAFRKVCKIHERLPDGGVLVFVSGQREVELLIKWLRLKYPPASDHSNEEKARAHAHLNITFCFEVLKLLSF